MRKLPRGSIALAAGVTMLSTLAVAAPVLSAAVYPLRQPQVAFQSASLQAHLDAYDGGIHTLTDQLAVQTFKSDAAGSLDFLLAFSLTANTASNTIGVYNAGDANPTLFTVFPEGSTAGYTATCRFTFTGLPVVDLFDELFSRVGGIRYTGVTRDSIGIFFGHGSTTYYSQDGRNGGQPQALIYSATNAFFQVSPGWWECLEDMPYAPNLSTFDSAVLLLQPIVPSPCFGPSSAPASRVRALLGVGCVPTVTSTWGQLKAIYR